MQMHTVTLKAQWKTQETAASKNGTKWHIKFNIECNHNGDNPSVGPLICNLRMKWCENYDDISDYDHDYQDEPGCVYFIAIGGSPDDVARDLKLQMIGVDPMMYEERVRVCLNEFWYDFGYLTNSEFEPNPSFSI